jgi:predicted dehydrogenase
MKCKVAFIGAGYMATEHLKAFKDIEGVELVGIYSRTRSRAEQLAQSYGIHEVFDNIEELYTRTNADIVVISVPELAARKVATVAFQFPWICLLEKPVGFNVEDAEEIIKVQMQFSAKAYVALNRRHYGSTRAVKASLEKSIGPRLVQVLDQEDTKAALGVGQPELVVKNWMYANSIHVIDYFQLFCRGTLISVENIIPWDPETPFLIMSKLTYDSGDIGIYQAVWNAPGPWSVVISTPEKRFEMRPVEFAFEQVYGKRVLEPLPVDERDNLYKPGIRVQAEVAVKAVLEKNFPVQLPTLEDALTAMKITRKIYFNE